VNRRRRPWVAAWTFAGFVVCGPGGSAAHALTLAAIPAPASADSVRADSTAADTSRTPAPAPVPPPAPAPAPPPSASAPPAPALHAELKPQPRSKTRAWIAIGSGAALSIGSFFVARAADQAYDDYLGETDPGNLEDHYQDAKTLDRMSAGMLIAGQAAIALGIYWGFIQRPKEAPVRTFGIAPDLAPGRAGVAIVVPLP
jgi:hypothetical protein